jgi:hypothetical protein
MAGFPRKKSRRANGSIIVLDATISALICAQKNMYGYADFRFVDFQFLPTCSHHPSGGPGPASRWRK